MLAFESKLYTMSLSLVMFSFSKFCVYLSVVYFASTFSVFDLVFRETKDENSNDI